ncbi:MAG TPA: hypothetical protein VK702_10925, partial [Candidatus Acidoferrum sp.]|nr:hypothetical protein [Candidatus Acidoferrum sp.]
MSIAIAVAVLVCAILGSFALRAGAAMRAQRADVHAVTMREEFILDAVRVMLDASRRSSEAVIEALARLIARRDPAIDAVLAFTPRGEELECALAEGARVQHFVGARLRRDVADYLPSRAALDGHRATGYDGLLVPTDRIAIAVPMADAGGLRAVIYASSSVVDCIEGEETIVRTIEHAALPYTIALERE